MKARMLIVAVLLVIIAALLLYRNIEYSETVYPINMQVIEPDESGMKFGISVDPDLLNFGKVPEGSSSEKAITIRNPEDAPVKIRMYPSGDISEYISFEKNDFVINKNQEEKVYIRAEGKTAGNFTGSLVITAGTVGSGWLEWMVPLL
ncbi:MAG: hypothetical protein JW754_01390 [Candidatus Aenigmarchaeota archaeon]|nr:hypothetical protein [Candidatus Aenigmarchaeota archaeon]